MASQNSEAEASRHVTHKILDVACESFFAEAKRQFILLGLLPGQLAVFLKQGIVNLIGSLALNFIKRKCETSLDAFRLNEATAKSS